MCGPTSGQLGRPGTAGPGVKGKRLVSVEDDLGGGFGRIWFATGATAIGAQVAQLALPLLAVVSLHASSGQVGLLGAAQWLPFLLIAPVGVLVDRRRRRPLLVAAE